MTVCVDPMEINFDEELNEEQLSAVKHIEGPMLVLAGAGSGKTRTVTYRISYLLSLGVPESQILGLTFTNKAAEEMKERVKKLTHRHVWISTFHRLGVRILRESIDLLGLSKHFSIYDEEDSDKVLKSCLKDLGLEDKRYDSKAFKSAISREKNNMSSYEAIDPSCDKDLLDHLSKVWKLYDERLRSFNAVDFDDLIYLPVKLFMENTAVLEKYQEHFQFLLVDEYQDTNNAQYQLIKLLAERHQNIFVVGDPDQAIYSWRGATMRHILSFEEDFPGAKVVRIEENYRSYETILEAANALILQNSHRYDKRLKGVRGKGELIQLFTADHEREEASFVADMLKKLHRSEDKSYGEMAVFYRTNFQSRALEDEFLSRAIPYTIVGGLSFYQRREIKDLIAYLKMAASDHDFIAFSRTINLPKRGIGQATLDKLKSFAELNKISILESCHRALQGEDSSLKLTPKQISGIREYLEFILKLRETAKKRSMEDLVDTAIHEGRYLEHLREERETYDDRKENLDALLGKAIEWDEMHEAGTLEQFLEELTLKSSLDETSSEEEKVKLMTLHNSKGLEFSHVFIIGLEEDLLPHANSRDSDDELEEERRLLYVGMTRAKDALYLTHALYRYLFGSLRTQRASRFIREIPKMYLTRGGASYSYERTNQVEEIEEAYLEDLKPGDSVFHKDFGVGIVQESYESTLGLTYKVLFAKENRPKSLVAKYAKLKKL